MNCVHEDDTRDHGSDQIKLKMFKLDMNCDGAYDFLKCPDYTLRQNVLSPLFQFVSEVLVRNDSKGVYGFCIEIKLL